MHFCVGDLQARAAGFVQFDLLRRQQEAQVHAFLLAAQHFVVACRHFLSRAAIHHVDHLGAEAARGAGVVGGDVAAADDGDALADDDVGVRRADQAERGGAQEGRAVHHVGQAVAGQAELVAALGADADEDRLVALRKEVVHLLDPGVVADLDAELGDFRDFLVDDVERHAIGGDAVARHAAGGGQGVEDGDAVAFFGEVVGGRESGRAGADDGGFFSARRQLLRILTPEAGVVVGGDALQAADGDGLVEVLAPAGRLAGREAGAAENARERQFFTYHGDGFGILAEADELDVARHVDAGRAGVGTRHLRFRLARDVERAVHQGAGRADRDAGGAELATGFDQRRRDGADPGAAVGVLHFQAADAAHFVAGHQAAAAVDAQVVVAVVERLVLDDRQLDGLVGRGRRRDADVVGHLAQFAVAENGTAARFHRIAEGAGGAAATLTLRTGETDVGMRAEYLGNAFLSQLVDGRRFRRDAHIGFHRDGAGGAHARSAGDLDHAEIAAAVACAALAGRGQVGMGAQRRYVDSAGTGRGKQ